MERPALYYPFHLCSRDTLTHLLSAYALVHFRDYMALQLTPMCGTWRSRTGSATSIQICTHRAGLFRAIT